MADDNSIDWGAIVQAGLDIAAVMTLQAGLNSIFGPKQPKALGDTYPLRQSRPVAVRFGGDYSKTAGANSYHEAFHGFFCDVQPLSLGRLDSFESFWLNEDKVSLDGFGWVTGVTNGNADGRYLDEKVNIRTRLGLPTETSYTDFLDLDGHFPEYTSTMRGDGIGSVMTYCLAPKPPVQTNVYPGGKPNTSVSARGVCYDWRDDAQDRNDSTTWAWSTNPVVWLVHYEWSLWGADWDEEIAPVLVALTTQADICDETVALAAGGTEKRYTWGGNFYDDADEDSTRQKILQAMDGYYSQDGLGRLVIKAGKYEAPTFVIDGIASPKLIKGFQWNQGTPQQSAADQLLVSYTAPEADYKQIDVSPWVINEDGNKTADFYPEWCRSWTQARRLAKRQAVKLMPAGSGWIRTGVNGINGMGQRYIRVRANRPNGADPLDVVCEVTEAKFEWGRATFLFTIRQADPAIDAWSPTTEEGDPPAITARPAKTPLSQPTINTATPEFTSPSQVQIAIDATGPSRDDIVWWVRWKLTAAAVWTETQTSETGGTASLLSPLVPVSASIDVEVAYQAGGALSPWSTTSTVSTDADSVAPGPVTSPAATGAAGHADLSWRNPSSTNFDHVVIKRATNVGMTTGLTTVATVYGSAGGLQTYTDPPTGTIAAGTFYYTFTAYNAAATASTTPAPVSAVVT